MTNENHILFPDWLNMNKPVLFSYHMVEECDHCLWSHLFNFEYSIISLLSYPLYNMQSCDKSVATSDLLWMKDEIKNCYITNWNECHISQTRNNK